MEVIFELCVNLLVLLAERLGITYQEVNVYLFVILWPLITLVLIMIALSQDRQIRHLRKYSPSQETIEDKEQEFEA